MPSSKLVLDSIYNDTNTDFEFQKLYTRSDIEKDVHEDRYYFGTEAVLNWAIYSLNLYYKICQH